MSQNRRADLLPERGNLYSHIMSNPFEAIDARLSSIEAILARLSVSLPKIIMPPLEDNIGVDEAAKILRISKQTVYTKTHLKIIPHFKRGKALIFSRKALEAFIICGRVNTRQEEINDAEKYTTTKLKEKLKRQVSEK